MAMKLEATGFPVGTRGLLHKALHGIEQGAAAGLGAAHEHTPEANANGSGLLGSQ